LQKLVRDVDVFARVSPVTSTTSSGLQASGEVVAMTGDGSMTRPRCAPPTSACHGVRGTDVARDVADVVLLNDDFAGIVAAVEQGRTIHTNIGKSLRFLLATNFSEIIVTLGALAGGCHGRCRRSSSCDQPALRRRAGARAGHGAAEADTMARPPRDPAARCCRARRWVRSRVTPGSWPPRPSGSRDRPGALRRGTARHHARLLDADGCAAAPRPGLSLAGTATSGRPVLLASSQHHRGPGPGDGVSTLRRLLGLVPLASSDWALVTGGAIVPFLINELAHGGIMKETRHGT